MLVLRSLIAVALLGIATGPLVAEEMTSFARRDRPGRPERQPPARATSAVSPAGAEPTDTEPAPDAIVLEVNGQPLTYRGYRQVIADATPTWLRLQALPEPEIRGAIGKRTREEMAILEEHAAPEFMRQMFSDQDAERKRWADELYQRALAGEDWPTLVREYTMEPRAEKTGGKTGARKFFDLPSPLGRHAFDAQVGEILPPILTVFGYHVARVDGVYPARDDQPERRELSQALLMWSPEPDSRGNPQDLRFIIAEYLQRRLVVEVIDRRFCDELPNICAENAAEAAARADASSAADGIDETDVIDRADER